MEPNPFVGLLFEEIPLAHLAALAFDSLGRRAVRNDV